MKLGFLVNISKKLPIAAAILTLITVGVTSVTSYMVASEYLSLKSDEKLQSIADGRRNQVESYLDSIEIDIRRMSTDEQAASAFIRMFQSWSMMSGNKTVELQKRYITDNPNPLGEKHKLDTAGVDGYDKSHKKYHNYLRDFIEHQGYYDLFLINDSGDVVYSVFKELDYATNLEVGEWKDSGLARVWKDVMANDGSNDYVAFDDYAPYGPSADAPASFIAKRLSKRGRDVGTLILQMPNDEIARIMSNTTGMGDSGETVLLRSDGVMITDSKKTDENEALKTRMVLTQNLLENSYVDQPVDLIDTYRGELFHISAARIDFADQHWIVTALIADREVTKGAVALRNIILIIALLLTICAIGAAFLFSRSITKPLDEVIDNMTDLVGGNTNVDLSGANRSDEIGKIFKAVSVFRDAAIEKNRLEEEGEENRASNEQERNRNEELKEMEAAKLAAAIDALAKGLTELSEGDLTANIATPFEGSLDRLRVDFNQSVEKLAQTMTEISNVSVQLKDNSSEISNATNELSQRTETQAASLEETSAALDEITATVRQTSERAKEAADKAKEARDDTEQSSLVVANAVSAMEGIEKASTDISNIINVIDEIAFQTNLLALNAGVEAARAGEAGKGFAVVAQEVRELAGRSATAAKQIKELISNSGKEVSNGVSLVKATGEALTEISEQVYDIDTHIQSIARASSEQSEGLNEVNKAVNEMDQVTQRNAAMVEETNAVTHRLSEEADKLKGLVGQFQTEKTANRAGKAPAPRQAAQSTPAPKRAAPRQSAPVAATQGHSAVRSPAHAMVNKVAAGMGGAPAADGNWDKL